MGRPEKYSSREKIKSKIFSSVLYEDSTSYNYEEILKNIKANSVQYAYIVHDKDEVTLNDLEEQEGIEEVQLKYVGEKKKKHTHVVWIVDNSIQLGLAANIMGIPSNYVKKVKNKVGALQYLIHKNNPEKYQYEPECIVTNIENFRKKYTEDLEGIVKAIKIMDFIDSIEGPVTISAVARWSTENYCWDEFRRGQHLFTAIIKEHNFKYGGE